MLTIPKILVLAVIQGTTELLPVSSSAHVIVAEKFMGLDPTTPEMAMLLIMLHTGTMLAVIVFFWDSWKKNFFSSAKNMWESIALIAAATVASGVVFLALKAVVSRTLLKGVAHPHIELLFGNLPLIASALAAAGVLILWAGYTEFQGGRRKAVLDLKTASIVGLVQGLCLPFRGFSRSGATISTGLILGIEKRRIEDFSFALAVVLTPLAIFWEADRLLKAHHAPAQHSLGMVGLFVPGLIGMALSFVSGLAALKWLSDWLEHGRWYLFGTYCLCASVVIFFLHCQGL
jgi:undecaprenyl-diphosphatase